LILPNPLKRMRNTMWSQCVYALSPASLLGDCINLGAINGMRKVNTMKSIDAMQILLLPARAARICRTVAPLVILVCALSHAQQPLPARQSRFHPDSQERTSP